MQYYIQTTVERNFEQAAALAKQAIEHTGFGVVSEIDLHEKLRASMNVEYPKYKILGACNPAYSYKAIQADDNIGLLLPCNILVKEKGDNLTEISAVDPVVAMNMVENSVVEEVATEVKKIMQQVLHYIKEHTKIEES